LDTAVAADRAVALDKAVAATDVVGKADQDTVVELDRWQLTDTRHTEHRVDKGF
jgi:hypothetical protein